MCQDEHPWLMMNAARLAVAFIWKILNDCVYVLVQTQLVMILQFMLIFYKSGYHLLHTYDPINIKQTAST